MCLLTRSAYFGDERWNTRGLMFNPEIHSKKTSKEGDASGDINCEVTGCRWSVVLSMPGGFRSGHLSNIIQAKPH